MLQNWLSTCENTHEWCPWKHPTRPIQLRLLDVDKLCIEDFLNTSDQPLRYAALSYVWGSRTQRLKLEQANVNALHLEGGIETTQLSRTIRDAVSVVRMLGERYLWVDSMCIIQDSEDDLGSHLPLVGYIYAKALVTIVAASGDHNDVGLCGINGWRRLNSAERMQQPMIKLDKQRLSNVVRSNSDFYHILRTMHQQEVPTWSWLAWKGSIFMLSDPLADESIDIECYFVTIDNHGNKHLSRVEENPSEKEQDLDYQQISEKERSYLKPNFHLLFYAETANLLVKEDELITCTVPVEEVFSESEISYAESKVQGNVDGLVGTQTFCCMRTLSWPMEEHIEAMIIIRDDGVAYRKGIADINWNVWMAARPKRELIILG
ncbi:MAG: hypothetical protein LQ346_004401 [Caloplaca aetnensis]|nr:MAG: hypothetical protein LQ346_004401 [Caloplaca aetnensis]